MILQTLNIKNLATISHQKIDFKTGFTVITGPSGAGKSLIFKALHLAFGGKASNTFIRPGCEQAEIILSLDLSQSPELLKKLIAAGIPFPEKKQLLTIQRFIAKKGSLRAKCNQHPVSQELLQNIGQNIVQWHVQHQALSLLQANEQRELLDAFAKNTTLLKDISLVHHAIQNLNKTIEALARPTSAEQELLHYQLEELKNFAPIEAEYPKLLKEYDRLIHAQELAQNLDQALGYFEGEADLIAQVFKLEKKLYNLPETVQPKAALTFLKQANIHLEEAFEALQIATKDVIEDPERLISVSSRLEQYGNLARKHKCEPEQLFSYFNSLEQRNNKYVAQAEEALRLAQELETSLENYRIESKKLHESRKLAASSFAAALITELKTLGLPAIQLEIRVQHFEAAPPNNYGNDQISWWVSMNSGHPLAPLASVSSGGELSRLSLVANLLTSEQRAISILFFDEVDTGLGGDLTRLLGASLAKLGQRTQVLCISHAAPLSTMATHHLCVSKSSIEEQTFSCFNYLTMPERIVENARLLGSTSKQALTHAKALMN